MKNKAIVLGLGSLFIALALIIVPAIAAAPFNGIFTSDSIEATDEAPVMNDQTFGVDENSPFNTLVGKLVFTDNDPGDTHTFTIETGNGTGAGAFLVEPDAEIRVKDSLQLNHEAVDQYLLVVKVTDFIGNFDTATITINVNDVNEPPVATGYASIVVPEDSGNTTVNLYGGFTDPDQLSSGLGYTIQGNSNPALFSSVSISLPNLELDYAPDANGSAKIKIRATDSEGLSAETELSVTVNPVNDNPTTTGISDVNVSEGTPSHTIILKNSFFDKEDGSAALVYSHLVTNDTQPSLFNSVTIDQSLDTLTLVFKPNAFGTAQIKVRATDSGNLFVEDTFNVTVTEVNDPPVLQNFVKNITEDIAYSFQETDFTSNYTDPESVPLVNVKIVSLPANATLTLNGVAMTVNSPPIPRADLSKLKFTPNLNWNGSTSFNWNASDGTSYAVTPASATFNVAAANDAPVIEDVEKPGDEGVIILFVPSDFIDKYDDVEGSPLNEIRIEDLPQHGTLKFDSANVIAGQEIPAPDISKLTYVPDPFYFGEDRFGWSGSDGLIFSAPAEVIITLEAQNDAPALDLNGAAAGTGFSVTYAAAGTPKIIVGQGVTITDVDDTMMEGATITILNPQHGTQEILDAVVAGTNITKQFNAGSGSLLLAGTDTIANYEKVLRTITYAIDPAVTNVNTAEVRDVSIRVYDGELLSNETISMVTVINPRIQITVEPPIRTVIRGDTAQFTVLIENTGSEDLENVKVTSAKVPSCNREFGIIEVGKKLGPFPCSIENVQGRIDNVVKVTAVEPQTNTQVSDEDEGVVRLLQNISIDISPAPSVGDVLVKGQNAVFNVTVVNPSQAELTEVKVLAFVDYDLAALSVAAPAELVPAPACDKALGTLGPGKETTYSCTIPNVQQSFKIEVQVSGKVDGITPMEDFDIAEISVVSLNLEVFAVPFEVVAGEPTVVEYSMTLSNISNVPLTLSELSSSLHGNLLSAANSNVSSNTCAGLNLSLGEGEVRTCSYKVTLSLESGAITNVITSSVTGDGKQLTVTDEALVSVSDFSPVVVLVSADPANIVAPGGLVNLTVQVTNNTSSELTLDSLTDSVVGNLNGKGTCELPRAIQGNSSYSCTYTVTIAGKKPGDVVTHTVTAIAGTREASNSAAISVTSSEPVYLHMPVVSSMARAGEPNNGICSAMQVSTNQNYYFYADDSNDWYRFTVGSSGAARIKLTNFMVTKGQLLVYEGDCSNPTRIGHNGDTGIVPNREIVLNDLEAGKTYYIWVLSSEGLNPATPYSLRVEMAGP